jgi:hypothetical protein
MDFFDKVYMVSIYIHAYECICTYEYIDGWMDELMARWMDEQKDKKDD